ncbi:MAG: TldD/PmbA family protein [candidate division WOR-3 bacterium]|nr:MAG: TldD/PmbA family protein [candidate division WOR-3 bacterium]
MVDEILALAHRRGVEAEVYSSEVDRTLVEFRSGRHHSQETRLVSGYGLRVIKDGRLGFAASTNQDRPDQLLDAAIAVAEESKDRRAVFEFPPQQDLAPVHIFENRVMLVSPDRMAEWGKDLVSALKARVPGLKLDLSFVRTYREMRIRNSSGMDLGFERAEFELDASGLIVGDGLTWIFEYLNLSDGRPFNIEPLADRLEQKALWAQKKASLPSGEWPVIVMPTALTALLLPVTLGVDGKNREKKTSPLVEREGESVVAETLSIHDNPVRSHGMMSSPVDAEGMTRQKRTLFTRGVFNGFLYDIRTAAACGTETTASADRPWNRLPQPSVSNIEIDPGDRNLDYVLAETKQGLVVDGFIGEGQSNLLAGEVALNASSAFKIEDGAISGRVKDIMIAGNSYEMLSTVDAVGDRQRDLGRWFIPFVRLPSLRIASRE